MQPVPSRHRPMTGLASGTAVAALLALGACAARLPPDPTHMADTDMVRVLATYQQLGARPVCDLGIEQARAQPTPGDAAMAVQRQLTGNGDKQPVARVTDITVQGATGPLPARLYDPRTDPSQPAPVILYFHGGGWATGTLDTDDASDRALAAGTGAIVLSVQYRLAPEARFPAAQDDADKSYNWLLSNAASIGGDPRRIAIAGEGVGGNMAIDATLWARDSHLPLPVAELLVYPVVGTGLDTPSYLETANAVPLNKATIEWYVSHTTNDPSDLADKRLNVIGLADLHLLPPTTIVSAQIDPLRSEGEALAARLQQSGVDVQQRTYPGVTHAFFGMGAVVAQAKLAEQFADARLVAAFAAVPAAPPQAPAMPHHRHHPHPQGMVPRRSS